MFVKATIVDENTNLVTVQDKSISRKEVLSFTVTIIEVFLEKWWQRSVFLNEDDRGGTEERIDDWAGRRQ